MAPFGVHDVLVELISGDGSKGPEADVQGNVLERDAILLAVLEQCFGEVEAGGGCGHRAGVPCKNGLVSLPVVFGSDLSLDVGRQGDGTEVIQ